MKIKLLYYFLFFVLGFNLLLSCGNSLRKPGSNNTGDKTGNISSSNAHRIKLTDNHVKSYIKVTKELYKSSPELLEQVQAQVPVDLSGYTNIITNSGFKNLQEFKNTSLVISICMSTITNAEHLEQIQAKTKEVYINEFTEDLDDEDEFDRLFREKAEKLMKEELSELESQGLIGQNMNYVGPFIKKLKEKVGEKSTNLVIRYYDAIKSIWMYKY